MGRTRCTSAKARGGALFRLLVALSVMFAAVALAWMLFLPVVLTSQLRARTGFDATVQRLTVNPFTGRVHLRGLVVTNPPTFPVSEFMEVREFQSDLQVLSLLSGRTVFDSLMLDVAGVTLVIRPDGQTNAGAFQHYLSATGEGLPQPAPAARHFLVRHLTLRLDRLVIADHSGRLPVTHEYPLHLNQSYTDVTNVKQLLSPLGRQSLAPVGLALKGLVPGELGEAITDATKDAAKAGAGIFKNLGRKTGEKVKGFFDALEESRKP